MSASKTKKSRGKARKQKNKIDVSAIFRKPIKVGKNGRTHSMTPFEIQLRALMKRALKEKSLNAIKTLIEIALKYDLVPAPRPPIDGGVLVVEGPFTDERLDALFSKPDASDGGCNSEEK